jgi:hypothetical protein
MRRLEEHGVATPLHGTIVHADSIATTIVAALLQEGED